MHITRTLCSMAILCALCASTLLATDTDSDGVPDGADNCPSLFNPYQNIPPTKLNDPLVPGGDIGASADILPIFLISPDNTRVVYAADQEEDLLRELYSVPIAGGPVTKLNGPMQLQARPGVIRFQACPDSSRVVYQADQDTYDTFELYSVPIAGGPGIKLNGPLDWPFGLERGFLISPDSSRVVYVMTLDWKLYSVLIGGGTPLALGGGVSTIQTSGYRIAPDSSRVVYLADPESDGVVELYSVPIDGGMPVKLNGPLTGGGSVSEGFRISADSTHVVYRADQESNDVFELYSVPIAGGVPAKLNGTLVAGGDVAEGGRFTFGISPDSSRVVYRADEDTDEVFELYSVSITGGAAVKLNASGQVRSALITGGSSRVAYEADQDVGGVFELYSVPITGGAAAKLNDPLVAGGEVGFEVATPDGSRVVYVADEDTDDVFELYSVPITGAEAPTKLNGPLPLGGDVPVSAALLPARITPDGSLVVYVADQDADEVFELYRVPIAGGDAPKKLNGPLPPGGYVSPMRFGVATSVDRVAYMADQDVDNVFELYSSPLHQESDGDQILDPCDCEPANPSTYPGAPEVNDGEDNHCPGDLGNGIADELSGITGFVNPGDRNEYSWPLQGAATAYEAVRSSTPDFATGCILFATMETAWSDGPLPAPGEVFYYLARSVGPHIGSWGQESSGAERSLECASLSGGVSSARRGDRRQLVRMDHVIPQRDDSETCTAQ